jgi:hypothetical protein
MARSLGTLEAIRPRVPSLFEPYRRGAGSLAMRSETGWGAGHAMEQGSAQSSMATASPAPPLGAVESASAVRPREGADLPDSSMPGRGSLLPWGGAMPGSRQSAQAPANPDRHPQMETGDGSRNLIPLPGERVAGEEGRVQGSLVVGPSSDPLPGPRRLVKTPGAVHPFPSGEDRSRKSTPAWGERSGTPSDPDAGETHLAIPGHFSPVRPHPAEEMHGPDSLPRSSPDRPALQVTIGRVEVRAVFPAPPTHRAPQSKFRPALSLDDYLQRRDRGQR